MTPRPEWLGRLRYGWAWQLQTLRREAVIDGLAPEACWLLEHDPVITTGLRAVDDVPPDDVLRVRGVDRHRTERGGLATWHGPGQLVGYLILDLPRRGLRVRDTITAIEQGLIDWLADVGVAAGRRAGYPGVWLGADKVAAIGMHFRRGVSMHGFALNLVNDLDGFGLITPCGIEDGGVTTLERVLGGAPTPEEAAIPVGHHVIAALDAAAAG